MKTLLMKWNFLVVLFMICSVPLLVGCGDDDDDPDDVTTTFTGWDSSGNTAKFGYTWQYGKWKASVVVNLTFNGSGDDAICTKCVIEETWPVVEAAEAAESEYKTSGEVTNVKRNGKKVTYETDDYNGLKRGDIKRALEMAHPK
ncbi:hypothetical protein [uncultured Bacteroides sp.]|uniref:hypothetical protein n=1 Tax=uncultured Bacteroides sp. TaxID=162156 RepID=UPI00260DC21A|nr:hypothetical protein [uncultured Bacteroides sp.]